MNQIEQLRNLIAQLDPVRKKAYGIDRDIYHRLTQLILDIEDEITYLNNPS